MVSFIHTLAIIVTFFVGNCLTKEEALRSLIENADDDCASNYKLIESCHWCAIEENEKYTECKDTGYIELRKCRDGRIMSKRCVSITAEETKSFWKFEAAMIVLAVASVTYVMLRMRHLDDEHSEKINQQLSSI